MTILPDYNTTGVVFSIVGLSAVVPVLFLFRHYFRGLDFVQVSYFFAATMLPSAFSNTLGTSLVNFDYNFLLFCSSGDLVCSLGFQLSFGVAVAGALLFLLLVVSIVKCSKPHVKFEPLYLFLKGFFKWVYVPLAVYSTKALVETLDGTMDSTKLITSAAILGTLALFPFFQLIGYKCIQEEDTPIWRKWLEFLNYYRILSVSVLLGLALKYGDSYYCHFIVVPLGLYALLYVWNGEFKFVVAERIVFVVGEAAFIALIELFKYAPDYVTQYELDFFLLGSVLLLDFLLYLVKAIKLGCSGSSEGQVEIKPEETPKAASPKTASPKPKETLKVSKYEHDSGEDLAQSRDSITVNTKSLLKKKK